MDIRPVRFVKGHEFLAPNGGGYRLKRNVFLYDLINAQDFEPFGGLSAPKPGTLIPTWLEPQLRAANA